MERIKKTQKQMAPYGYILPIGLILGVFVLGSVLLSLALGFTKYNIMTEPVFKGVDNYRRLFSDVKFLKALKNTWKLMVIIVPTQTVSSLLIAVFLHANRNRLLFRLANAVVFIPVICADSVAGVVWRELLNGRLSAVESIFGIFGISPSMLLGSTKSALLTVGLIAVWKYTGYFVVIYSSGLMGISKNFYEAAKVDGAGAWKRFFSITLPLMRPTILLCIFLSLSNAIRCFDLIFSLTGGGPNNGTMTLTLYIYNTCFASGRAGYAMAISNALFGVIFVAALCQRRVMDRRFSQI